MTPAVIVNDNTFHHDDIGGSTNSKNDNTLNHHELSTSLTINIVAMVTIWWLIVSISGCCYILSIDTHYQPFLPLIARVPPTRFLEEDV